MSIARPAQESPFAILSEYVGNGDKDAVQQLIETAKSNDNWLKDQDKNIIYRACSEAIEKGETEIVNLFLAAGVPANAHVAVSNGNYSHDDLTLSFYAAKAGNLSLLENLLQRVKLSSDQEQYRRNIYLAMGGAVIGKQFETVKFLLAMGARADACVPKSYQDERFYCASVNKTRFYDESFFIYSIHQQAYDISALLLDHGVSIHKVIDDLKAVLCWKVGGKDEVTVKSLKDAFNRDLQDILDVAMGCDFAEAETIKFLDDIEDLSGFSIVGISFNGEPLTKEKIEGTLASHQISGWENVIDTPADFSKIADEARRLRLQNRLVEKQKQWGKLEDINGVVNLVPLVVASENGDFTAVKTRLQAGVHPEDTNFADNYKFTLEYFPYGQRQRSQVVSGVPLPMVMAAKNGHFQIVNLLLQTEKVSIENCVTAFALASQAGHKNITALLQSKIPLNAKDKKGRTLINLAAIFGDHAAITPLILAGNDANIPDNEEFPPIRNAIRYHQENQRLEKETNHLNVITTLLSHNVKTYKYVHEHKYDECVTQLFLRGFDFNVFSVLMPHYQKDDGNLCWILKEALAENDIRIYELFHQYGINFNVQYNEITFLNHAIRYVQDDRAIIWDDEEEMTPEEQTAHKNDSVKKGTQLIEFLIQHGADVNIPNVKDGQTALHKFLNFSSSLGWDIQRLMKLLIEANANWNAQDKSGFTALHYAIELQKTEWIKLLVSVTDINLKNNNDETATWLDLLEKLNQVKSYPKYEAIKAMLTNASAQTKSDEAVSSASHYSIASLSVFKPPVEVPKEESRPEMQHGFSA